MCPVEINSDKVGGVYVDGQFKVLPFTVVSGEKKLISHKYPPGFRYLVFGTDRGGYYMDTHAPFNSKIEIEPGHEVYLGQLTLTGKDKERPV
jgi:hypothetical protein